MFTRVLRATGLAVLLFASLSSGDPSLAAPPSDTSKSRIEAALYNILTLDRPAQDGFAAIWDGNKYVQCGRLRDSSLRCEAAGTLMQPSLDHVLTPERVSRLAALGRRLDPSFGNYVQMFPAGAATGVVADKISQVLVEGYDANATDLEAQST